MKKTQTMEQAVRKERLAKETAQKLLELLDKPKNRVGRSVVLQGYGETLSAKRNRRGVVLVVLRGQKVISIKLRLSPRGPNLLCSSNLEKLAGKLLTDGCESSLGFFV